MDLDSSDYATPSPNLNIRRKQLKQVHVWRATSQTKVTRGSGTHEIMSDGTEEFVSSSRNESPVDFCVLSPLSPDFTGKRKAHGSDYMSQFIQKDTLKD